MPHVIEDCHDQEIANRRIEAEPDARHVFSLRSLPASIEAQASSYALLGAMKPGQHLSIDLACGRPMNPSINISLPGAFAPAMAMLTASALWPRLELDLAGDQCSAEQSPDCTLLPLVPQPLASVNSADGHSLPHDPALWPWQINDALSILRECRGSLRIGLHIPWDKRVSMRRIDEMARHLQIAQLREPRTAAIEYRLALVAALRQEANLIEILVECSDHLDTGHRELLSLLLFGQPAVQDSGRTGTLCLARRLPKNLMPSRWNGNPCLEGLEAGRSQASGLALATTPLGAELQLGPADRMRHLYILGGTGTGKSTLMRHLIQQDIAAGEGVVLIDPHGDLAAEVSEAIPACRIRDVILADAGKGELSLPLLPMDGDALALERAVDGLVSLFIETLYDYNKEAFGPIFELYFRNAFILLAHAPLQDRRLENLPRIFEDRDFRRQLLADCPDARCVSFWRKTAEQTGGESSFANMTAYVTSKLTRMISGDAARRIFSGENVSQDPEHPLALTLEQALDGGKVVILPCPKGELGEGLSRLVVAALIMRLRQLAMARTGQKTRRPVRVYIDEFQGARGSELSLLLAEGRKYGISLTLANQSIGQLGGVKPGTLGAAVLANAGNLAMFRLGGPDAILLAPWLGGEADWRDLCNQPDFRFTARVLKQGRPKLYSMLRAPNDEDAQ